MTVELELSRSVWEFECTKSRLSCTAVWENEYREVICWTAIKSLVKNPKWSMKNQLPVHNWLTGCKLAGFGASLLSMRDLYRSQKTEQQLVSFCLINGIPILQLLIFIVAEWGKLNCNWMQVNFKKDSLSIWLTVSILAPHAHTHKCVAILEGKSIINSSNFFNHPRFWSLFLSKLISIWHYLMGNITL